MGNISRRRVLEAMASSSLLGLLGANLSACSKLDSAPGQGTSIYPPLPDDATVSFLHGVASGDPLSDSVIIWTRATPSAEGRVDLQWEMANDQSFDFIVASGTHTTDPDRDYTAKIDIGGLTAGATYYYRFSYKDQFSDAGQTRTLPTIGIEQISLAIFSCSHYPAGYFNVYQEALAGDYQAALHIGDYIYEYGLGGIGTEDAVALDRVPDPVGEAHSLQDYRTRYAQYRGDPQLQALHAQLPFIIVWDDHEVANNAWRDGAPEHDPATDGDYLLRKQQALQAFYEWLPVRPPTSAEPLYRRFQFGDLVDLYMLDTRHLARQRQLDFADFAMGESIDHEALNAARYDRNRQLIGDTQKNWLFDALDTAQSTWQVFGQQVLMGKMLVPSSIMAEYNKLISGATEDVSGIALALIQAVAIKSKDPAERTPEEQALLDATVPYNLDAWDGYAADQDEILERAWQLGRKLVVLAGDTHNGWANQLRTAQGDIAGVEFAGPSVSSPGVEYFIGSEPSQITLIESAFSTLIDDLKYVNASNRGFMAVTFTREEVRSQWIYVDTVKSENYQILAARGHIMRASQETLVLESA